MERKKIIIYVSCFIIVITAFIAIIFSSFISSSKQLNGSSSEYYRSITNLNQMEYLLYTQSLLIPAYFSGIDAPIGTTSAAFQSYVAAFLKLYKMEYDKASTLEEINYTFQINSQYNEYIDMFSTLLSYDLNDNDGRDQAYLYYRLSISPQTLSVYSSMQNYRMYLESAMTKEQNLLIAATKRTILILSIAFILLSTAIFILAQFFTHRKMKPLYNILEDHHKFEKTKSDFFSTISHEFKTPLTSIIMGTDLLQNSAVGELNEAQTDLVATIKEDSIVLSNQVNNLLQLSRIESSNVTYVLAPSCVEEIIRESMTQFSVRAENLQIKLSFLPQQPLPKINADSDKIVWVVNNLLSNAFKYSSSGSQIDIKAWQSSDQFISVSVSDSGPGIPPEYSEKIFEKYFQVHDSDIELGGTGLGLAISKNIIVSHGGDIWCTPNTPKGSIFTFTVPTLSAIQLATDNQEG